MLTVWSVCVGDKYGDEDVLILQDMVKRHMSQTHKFRCLSDRLIPGVETIITPVDWPGWWQKLALFTIEVKQCLYLDLDTVVVGSLDRLLSEQLSMPKNWAQSGHGGCQSSVMSWGKDYRHLGLAFDPSELSEPAYNNYGYYGDKRLWGDQELITDVMGDPGQGRILPMEHICSYKYHCRQKLPEDASVVCFHGNPKPAQVRDKWVMDSRLSTAILA